MYKLKTISPTTETTTKVTTNLGACVGFAIVTIAGIAIVTPTWGDRRHVGVCHGSGYWDVVDLVCFYVLGVKSTVKSTRVKGRKRRWVIRVKGGSDTDFPASDSLLSDDSSLKSTATSKQMEAILNKLANIDMDEDLHDIVNKICKLVFDETIDDDNNEDVNDLINELRMCILAISTSATKHDSTLTEEYKSELKKIIEGYSRVGVNSIKDVSLDQDAESSRMAIDDDGYVVKGYKNFKMFDTALEHSDNIFSTGTSPMKKVVFDKSIDADKDETLDDKGNTKRKEGTMAICSSAINLDSKDNGHSTKKARYDPLTSATTLSQLDKSNC
nr:hypothetical protein [Tanacetum cinerariifolium]